MNNNNVHSGKMAPRGASGGLEANAVHDISAALTSLLAFAVLAFLSGSAQAQAQSACVQAVEMARDNVALRINGGDNAQNSRESAKAHLDAAAMAAARGDEDRCWKLLYWSDYLISIPRPVAEQMKNATATAQQRPVAAPAPSGTPASYRSR